MSISFTPVEIRQRIHLVRGYRVILDQDIAELYQVETRSLNQAVQRNNERFPEDFMFKLTQKEVNSLRSQIVILEKGKGRHRKYLPYAFTEQGVTMLAAVLKSPTAVQVNIAIVRTFVKLRETMEFNQDLVIKINELERKYDDQFKAVFSAIRQLMGIGVPTYKKIRGLNQK